MGGVGVEEVRKVQQCSLTFCLKRAKKVRCWGGGEGFSGVLLFSLQEPAQHQNDFIDGGVGGFSGRQVAVEESWRTGSSLCMSQSFCSSLSASVCLLCKPASVGGRTSRGQR